MPQDLTSRLLAGDERALARAITLLERGDLTGEGTAVLAGVRRLGRVAPVVGLTGPPGAGKSTLTDALLRHYRSRGETVAVLAVDPSSPYSGGAVLGDRIRMLRHSADRGVFVRSMASRGALGGLAPAAVGVLALLEGFGFSRILLETVGVGQSEVDIARVADHSALVLTPAGGDGVQAFKAGIMEIAELFVVNKADLPGAGTLEREIRAALELGPHDAGSWLPPVVQTVASSDQGTGVLADALERHRGYLGAEGLRLKRLERARFEVELHLRRTLASRASDPDLLEQVHSGQLSAGDAALRALERR